MKYKTSKLRKLEANRYSIMTNNLDKCYLCFGVDNCDCNIDIHEIYGGANRQISMQNGFCIPLCRYHHSLITRDNASSLILKKQCQKKFEETHTREEFMCLVGKNYLE